jgi:hypothetical protein
MVAAQEVPMRTMLRIQMPADATNKAVKEGLLPKLVQQTTELIKPEAAYFTADNGMRTAYFFFELKDSSQIPSIAEPWFTGCNAKIDLQPVMNNEELRTGLERALRK